jgi:hypothetical protein
MFQPVELDNEVFIMYWWAFLSFVSFFNLCYLLGMVNEPYKNSKSMSTFQYDRGMRLLTIPFVMMTCWRSFFPCKYTERYTLFDNWMSSVFVCRAFATIGEIAFVTQIGMGVRRANYELIQLKGGKRTMMNSIVDLSAYLLTIFCTIAQLFCIYQCATQSNWHGAIEETLWGLSHALLAPCALYLFV